MGWLFLGAFIGIPLIEIAVFIQVGGIVGLGPTLIIVILTAVIGTALLRRQGLATLNRARQQMDQGSLPLAEIFDAVCLLIAGAFLLTPGFVTDGFGALLLIPAVRAGIRKAIAGRVQVQGAGQFHGQHPGAGPFEGASSGHGGYARPGDIIDGDFTDLTDKPDDHNPQQPGLPPNRDGA